ncbi:sarcocystatin-A [Ceratitis capitata]|uniref:(Mediterranean fruit fly) hypothetical protein n=2 Tax=Ceratitis capitata TaxID=7213 RepID=A0A811U2I2_CERCA|nr:sarcocystatin-A [Ceratitis capitata]CAD6993234.1 unnamed protein product [Ceratitis capitata]
MVSMKLFVFVLLSCVIATVYAMPNEQLLGGESQLSGADLKEAESELQESLTKLKGLGEGPDFKISKVNSASRQVVSGTLLKLDVDLQAGNEIKKCLVEIWSQPWLENGIQVTFNCPGGEKIVRKHSA